MKDPKSRVIKLLRLAEDRAGTPEGDTAKRLAETIMETHGISVEPEAIEFEEPPEVAQIILAENDDRQWWQEMLLVTLTDIYGGECVPMQFSTQWRLYAVIEPDDEVNVDRLRQHFDYLCSLVFDLRDVCAAEFMRALPHERDGAVSSFSIGAVFRISQMLYRQTVGEEPNLEQMPFMIRALKGAVSEAEPQDSNHETIALDVTHTDVGSLGTPNSSPPPENPTAAPDVVEVVPDWHWFDSGYRSATSFIHRVEP